MTIRLHVKVATSFSDRILDMPAVEFGSLEDPCRTAWVGKETTELPTTSAATGQGAVSAPVFRRLQRLCDTAAKVIETRSA
jgi:hypothetical protein